MTGRPTLQRRDRWEKERERETFTSYLRKKKKAVPLGLKKM